MTDEHGQVPDERDQVRQERRRLARELHDTVAQELAFIVGQSSELARAHPGEQVLRDVAAAAAQALDGIRAAISGLHEEPCDLGEAVDLRVRELTRRAGLGLRLDIADEIEVSGEVRHAVVSLAQEAVSNAVRHADGQALDVSLRRSGGRIVMRVSDDGRGVRPQAMRTPQSGYGLGSMHERALGLGGDLTLSSVPGQGTTVELQFPAAKVA